ncbi:TetR/AcrR family transcriptional regulator C-terminal domain-containing protein [Catenulispora yoronensis]|uniref:TetR/AcrR family transcriptional regulator C-terminal domain-containing protein n=1 Tax=Catenulispora yoronensis TaxID=450799 RepID=A0ABN2TW44_9ACTN
MPAAEAARSRGSRGPGQKVGLTRQQILDAALALVDRDGLAALTMRSLGAELGVEAMTIYHYVPTKDALLDGIVERAFTLAAPPADPAQPWQRSLNDYAHGLLNGLLNHPGILPLASSRPAVTPDLLDGVEGYLRVLAAAGFPLGRALHAINALTVFVLGHATAAVRIDPAAEDVGAAAWVAELDPERYPLLVEAAATGQGTDDDERFALAVEALISGFELAGSGAGG